MGILVLFLLQLWNQPSVRLLGLSGDFVGFLPDPISDLTWNPAYLKTFGMTENTHDALQLHSKTRSFWSTRLYEKESFYHFYENDELLSFTVLYPKIGLGWRIGAWQRYDRRSPYFEDEIVGDFLFSELWLYGQQGVLFAVPIGEWIKIGAEYNFSWNNRADSYCLFTYDTLGNMQTAGIWHTEWSNEAGGGILLHNADKWELSLAVKNNWESDRYMMDTIYYFWREDEPVEYESFFQDLQINSHFRYRIEQLTLVGRFAYFRKDIDTWWSDFRGKSDYYRASFKSGIGICYNLSSNLIIAASGIYSEERTESGVYEKFIKAPIGFEYFHNRYIAIRFGNTFNYSYDCVSYTYIWNQINIGIEVDPTEKLKFYLANQSTGEHKQYIFGLFYSL